MVGLLVDSLYREQLEAEKRVHGTRGPAARPLWQVGLGLSVGLACLWKALYVLFRWHSKRLATGLVFVQYVARVGTLAVAVVVLESLVIRISVGATLIRQSDATLTAVITIFPGLGVASTTLLTPALGIGLAVARWLLFGVWLSVLVPMFGRSQASTIEQLESKRAILRKAWFLARLGERTARKVLRRLGSVGNDGQSG
jgi:hypothetical protein